MFVAVLLQTHARESPERAAPSLESVWPTLQSTKDEQMGRTCLIL